ENGHYNSLVPVVTVQLGDSVTFMCSFTETFQTVRWLHWYKQTTGENLKLITMIRKSTNPTFGPGISALRFNITYSPNISNLTILSTSKEDEGTYHCAHLGWIEATWTGTYLRIYNRTSRYTVVQQTSVSDPSHPTDSKTLQCSVLSDSEKKTCSEDHRVSWFRAGSDESHPSLIYAHGNSGEECGVSPEADSVKKCVYKFSKTVSSSDTGTYYCAVATCGQILFGKGAKLDNQGNDIIWTDIIFTRNQIENSYDIVCYEDQLMYSAVIFTLVKTDSRAIKEVTERQRIYTAVKVVGFN
uniref:Ig-like domain-containing protein n=1 Tax=Kryptolebias marmoratus TaxID=37003 RepID=A0A3Q3B8F9_KRYMA